MLRQVNLRWKSGLALITLALLLAGCGQNEFAYQMDFPSDKNNDVFYLKGHPFIEDPRATEIADGAKVWGGDAVRYFRFCNDAPELYCILGNDFAFVVPRHGLESKDRWVYEGCEHSVEERNVSVQIFGRRIDNLVLIWSPPCASAWGRKRPLGWQILYSYETGIVAYRRKEPGRLDYIYRMHWMQGEVGIGKLR